jgi:hypothetical protein
VIAHDPDGIRRALRRPMNLDEQRVDQFLARCGYHNVVFEPDGQVPPDFLVNGRIAIEVRRLNQNLVTADSTRELETLRISLNRMVEKLALSLGPPIQGGSWFLNFRLRRPIDRLRVLERKLRDVLQKFRTSETREPTNLEIESGFTIGLYPASGSHSTFYVMGLYTDRDANAWIVPEMVENLQICIGEKANKIARVRSKYPEWWLILVDRVSRYTLGNSDWDEIRAQLDESRAQLTVQLDAWDRIIVIGPEAPPPAFQLLKGEP